MKRAEIIKVLDEFKINPENFMRGQIEALWDSFERNIQLCVDFCDKLIGIESVLDDLHEKMTDLKNFEKEKVKLQQKIEASLQKNQINI